MGISLAFGVLLGTQAVLEPVLLLVVIVSLAAVAVATTETPRNIVILLIAGIAIGACAGIFRAPQIAPPFAEPPRTVVARITSDPNVESQGTSAWIEWRDARGITRKSFARFPAAPETGRGDTVEASVISQGVRGELLFVRQHVVVEKPAGAEELRRRVRQKLTSITAQRITGSPGTLTLGLLIGDDSALPLDERLELRRSGLSHITAVSGWNVTLVTGSIGVVFLAFGLRGWFWVLTQLSLMGSYVWIVGLDPPVTRAAIMAVVALTASQLGRPSHSITALSLSAAIMVMLDPTIVASLSFQLSVLATFALIAAMRMTERHEGWKGSLATSTLASSMTGLATAPVLAATFGTMSLATVPANIVAGPLVQMSSVGGVLVVALDIIPPVAAIVGWTVWILASFILVVARVSAALPFGYVEFQPLRGSESAIFHLLVFVAISAATPEGRLIRRRLLRWTAGEPRAAAAAGAGMAASLLTGLIVI